MISLYLPGSSPLHRAPAGAKLIGLVVLGTALSLTPRTPLPVGAGFALVAVGYAVAAFPPRVFLRQLWSTRWLVLLTAGSQLLFLTPSDAVLASIRVVSLVVLAALLTLTTRSEDLLDALVVALAPLRVIRLDPVRIGLTLSLTLAMIPVVASFAARIREAQRARGVRLGYRAVVPLLVLSLRHADDVADALTVRGVE